MTTTTSAAIDAPININRMTISLGIDGVKSELLEEIRKGETDADTFDL